MTRPSTAQDRGLSASDTRRAVRNVGALVVASILSKGFLFAWQIVLATWLGPFEYGIYQTVFPLLAIASPIVSLSMGMIAIREIARHPEQIGSYAGAMLFVQTFLSLVAYGGVVTAGVLVGYSETIIALTAIAGISLIVDMFGNIANDLLIAQERMVISSAVEIVQIVVRIGFSAAALWAGWGLVGIYLAGIFTGVGRSIVLWLVHYRVGLRVKWSLQWQTITKPLILSAAPLAAAAILSLAYDHTDKLMMTRFLGATNTGYIGPAFIIHFGVIELLSTTILVAMYPIMSRYYVDDNSETFGNIVEILARFMFMAALPIVLVLTVFSEDVIALVFSEDYAPTAGILQIYVWYTLFTMIGNVFAKALIIQSREYLTSFVRAASLTLNVILNAYLLWRFRDPRGAAVASVAAEVLAFLLFTSVFRAKGFHWSRILPASMRILVVACLMGAAMIIIGQVQLVLGMAAGVFVYIAGIIGGRILSTEDWDLLYSILGAMPGGSLVYRFWQRETTS